MSPPGSAPSAGPKSSVGNPRHPDILRPTARVVGQHLESQQKASADKMRAMKCRKQLATLGCQRPDHEFAGIVADSLADGKPWAGGITLSGQNEAAARSKNPDHLSDPAVVQVLGQMRKHGPGKHNVEKVLLEWQGRREAVLYKLHVVQILPAPANRLAIIVGSVELDRPAGGQPGQVANDACRAAAPLAHTLQAGRWGLEIRSHQIPVLRRGLFPRSLVFHEISSRLRVP